MCALTCMIGTSRVSGEGNGDEGNEASQGS